MLGISVIICCYNSSKKISETLFHLKHQNVNNVPWEVIIVDNNSNDDTVSKCLAFWEDNSINFSIVSEERIGLVYAREKGVKTARYDYLIFCDDDNWLDQFYLRVVYDLFTKNPLIGAIGGQSIPVFEDSINIPEWFEMEKNSYAVGKQALFTGDITYRYFLWGAGLAVRKKIAEKCFDLHTPFLLTGRSEVKVMAGDDSELCHRIILLGYRLYYDDRLKFRHYIPNDRLSSEYLIKLKEGFSKTYNILSLYSEYINIVIFNKNSMVKNFKEIFIDHKVNLKKLLRTIYWIYGVSIYVNNNMRLIRRFYLKNVY